MRSVFASIEQLDLAAAQLRIDNPCFRRFALILVDNIVELLCHGHCEFRLQFIDLHSVSPEERRDVLGSRFDRKINYLHRAGLLSDEQRGYILSAHGYRNESYHQGIVHDDIIYGIVWYYHTIACDLFCRLRSMGYCAYPLPPISPAVAAYIGDGVEDFVRTEFDWNKVAAQLSLAKPQPGPDLAEILANSAEHYVESADDSLAFLLKDDPQARPENELIVDIQRVHDIGNSFRDYCFQCRTKEDRAVLQQQVKAYSAAWQPKVRSKPFDSWRRRVVKLREQPDAAKALAYYENLKRDMAYFGNVVSEAASALDGYIQHQIDVARGK